MFVGILPEGHPAASEAFGPLLVLVAVGWPVSRRKRELPGKRSGGQRTASSIAAAGDLVCGIQTPQEIPCLAAYTAELVRQLQPHALLLLGDLQYETGSAQDFAAYFHPSFGEFKSITCPVPGNHEYFTPGARGYFDYFNGAGDDSGRAGSRRRGYYSFELGAVAYRRAQHQLSGDRRLWAEFPAGDLAARRPRGAPGPVHAGVFALGAIQLRGAWE